MAQPALALASDNGDDAERPHDKLTRWIKSKNIAADLDTETLSKIGVRVVKEFDIDEDSRSDWKEKTERAMDLAMQVAKEKQFPWPRAANVIFPLMTTASIQFAARAYPAIVQNRSVVKGVVIGPDDGQPVIDPQTQQPAMQMGPDGQPQPVWQVPPGAKQNRADEIGAHMSWQLLDEMPEWESETDTLLHILPIVGCDFRKSYFDPGKARNCSLRVSAMKLTINYKARSLETAPRLTEELEFYPNEIEEKFRSDEWIEPETPFGIATGGQDGDEDAPHIFLEQHRWWDLDDDGYREPYIVTVHKESNQVVRIVVRYEESGVHFRESDHKVARIDPVHYYTKYDFLPNPDGGIYGIGFGQLLRPINEAVNTTLNQMIDAGTLQNTGGGFIGKGLSMNAGAIRFSLGEYKVVNVAGGTVRENIIPMVWPGPSTVLFELLGMLIEAGKEIASIKDVLTGENAGGPNTPATTTLAIIEQGLKVFSAIYKRVHRGLKAELAKLYRLNRVYGEQEAQYKVGNEWRTINRQDYEQGSGVEPISDPTMVSDMQRLGRAQFLMQFMQDPMCDPHEIRHRILTAASIDNIDKVLLRQAPPNPVIAAKGMELEQKGHEIAAAVSAKKAQEVLYYAQAINQLAAADAAVGDQHLQWLNAQIGVWEKQFEAASTPVAEGQSAPSPGQAPIPPPLPHPMTMPSPAQLPNAAPSIDPHNPAAALPLVR
jgi:chaperonin GroES